MATFTAQDVGRTKELRIGGQTIKALITNVNTGSSLVSYQPVKKSPDPYEVVGAPVSNAAWASIDSQANWPHFAPYGRGGGELVPHQRVPGGPTEGVTYP